MRLRVMTYNIRWGRGVDGVFSLERIAEVIAASGADLVGLQEVERGSPRSRFRDMPDLLAASLGMHVAYGANLRLGPWQFGNALLSRHPIVSWRNVPLPLKAGRDAAGRGMDETYVCVRPARRRRLTPMRFLRRWFPGLVDRRGLLLAEVSPAPGLDLRCGVVHFPLSGPLRILHAHTILDLLEPGAATTLLMGDFNEEPGGRSVSLLEAAGLVNLSGEAPTFTSGRPRKKLDFVFGRGDLRRVCEPVVASTPASDHLPVVVEVETP